MAFLIVYILLLIVFRQSRAFLIGAIAVSLLSIFSVVIFGYSLFVHFDLSGIPLVSLIVAIPFFPFHGLSFFFEDEKVFHIFYAIIILLILAFKIFLLIKLKRRREDEKT
jgi:hypothetical protein